MTSLIDITKPESINATTASVRANFTAAKDEIEALQNTYETGTFTCDLLINNIQPLYYEQTATYTRVGNLITVSVEISARFEPVQIGLISMGGSLPYPPATSGAFLLGSSRALGWTTGTNIVFNKNSGTLFYHMGNDSTYLNELTNNVTTTDTRLIKAVAFIGSYITNA